MSEHDEIIAEAREKYTVHNCDQCEFRKSCNLGKNGFDSNECRRRRQSIMLGFGIEDGYFTKLLDRLEAAHKSDIEDAIAATVKVAAESASKVYELHIQSKPVGNAAKIREALVYLRDASRAFCHRILNSKYNAIYDKYKYPEVAKISDAIANAGLTLAEPARNCDVGSEEEQADRYINFCHNYPKCTGCPHVGRVKYNLCEFAWAQMPYEKGETK